MNTAPIKSLRGFTLIELLVTIAIIAVLAVIGITSYGTVQATTRDGSRRTLITQLGKAIESSKDGLTGTYKYTDYDYLSDFGRTANGTLYFDPASYSTRYVYCVAAATSTGLTYTPVTNGTWTSSACPSGSTLESSVTTVGCYSGALCFGNVKSWVLCARLERSTTPYCVSSSQ